MGLHIGHETTGSLEASGYADVTVFERELPTAGVIVAVANAHLLASLGRLDEAAATFRSLGPPAEWKPSPHATLPAFAFGVNLAIEVGADGDVATLVQRLGVYRGHHVCSGAGQVAYGRSGRALDRSRRGLRRTPRRGRGGPADGGRGVLSQRSGRVSRRSAVRARVRAGTPAPTRRHHAGPVPAHHQFAAGLGPWNERDQGQDGRSASKSSEQLGP